MKRLFTNLLAVLACVSIAFSLTSCGGADLVYANSQDGFLNIREEPTAKSSIVGRMYNGDEGATDLGIVAGDWMQVEQRGVVGWVHRNYVQSVPSSPVLMTNEALSGVWVLSNWWNADGDLNSHNPYLFFEDGTYAQADWSGCLRYAGKWSMLEGRIELEQLYNMATREKEREGKTIIVVRENSTKKLLDSDSGDVYYKSKFISDAATRWDSNIGKWSKTLFDRAHGEVSAILN